MQPRLDVGLRQEFEERRDPLVVGVRMPGEDPQARAARNGVLRSARCVRMRASATPTAASTARARPPSISRLNVPGNAARSADRALPIAGAARISAIDAAIATDSANPRLRRGVSGPRAASTDRPC